MLAPLLRHASPFAGPPLVPPLIMATFHQSKVLERFIMYPLCVRNGALRAALSLQWRVALRPSVIGDMPPRSSVIMPSPFLTGLDMA